jgi:hypothetical protein
MNSRLAAILVLLVCWAFASALTDVNVTASPSLPSFSATNGTSSSPSPSGPACDDTYTCVSEGDSCSFSWAENPHNCTTNSGNDCCAHGLICFNGKCADNNYGAACKSSADCISQAGEALTCSTNNTCAYLSYAGDSCGDDDDDITVCAPGLTCQGEVCLGQLIGANCSADKPCNNGLYCPYFEVHPTCQYLLPNGADCSDYPNACNFQSYCNSKNCTAFYNVVEGGHCTSSNDCADGNICEKAVCVSSNDDDDLQSCESNTDCTHGGICLCSQFSGEKFCTNIAHDSCYSERTDANTCAAKYNCTNFYTNENSCFYENCYSELEDLQSCGCSDSDSIYSSCFYSSYCGGFPGWAIALIVVGAIAVVLAIVAVIFVVMKRNSNTYDSI